ncbi:hypothetical protein WJX73_007071 [Symbiochloris irregularis]|uniref:Calcium load-activated calcium channel n=1 Tax=Symbiochloris irregularis TaxID=706552 RepID=A0AAW1Q3I8_9CHLO
MVVGLPDIVEVVLFNFLAVLLSEIALYYAKYRQTGFKSVKEAVRRQVNRDSGKNGLGKLKSGRERKLERKDNNLKRDATKEVAMLRVYQGGVTAVMIFTVYRALNLAFWAKSIAKLPFEPASFLRMLAHRGLESPAANDCSMAFVLALCQLGIRPNLSLALGWGPSRRMNAMSAVIPNQQDVAAR